MFFSLWLMLCESESGTNQRGLHFVHGQKVERLLSRELLFTGTHRHDTVIRAEVHLSFLLRLFCSAEHIGIAPVIVGSSSSVSTQ